MVNPILPDTPAAGATVVGYYTLAMSEVPTFDLPDRFGKLPYKMVPSILIARLAVDNSLRGKGLGTYLLGDAIGRCLAIGQTVGCRCIVVDAYDSAADWYKKFGFVAVNESRLGCPTCRMILDLLTVAKGLPTDQRKN
jgi:predicted GNAT family N-acyltransferase